MNGIARILKRHYLFLVLFFLIGCIKANAQQKALAWKDYIKELQDSADKDHYVYLYYTRGGKMQKVVHCLPYKKEQLMAINIGDTLFNEALIIQPDLFAYLQENRTYLNAAKVHFSKEKNRKRFRKDFSDTNLNFLQLGMKINGLHYNHFQRTTPELIAELKNKKTVKGYEAINHIIDLIEKSAAQSLAEKN